MIATNRALLLNFIVAGTIWCQPGDGAGKAAPDSGTALHITSIQVETFHLAGTRFLISVRVQTNQPAQLEWWVYDTRAKQVLCRADVVADENQRTFPFICSLNWYTILSLRTSQDHHVVSSLSLSIPFWTWLWSFVLVRWMVYTIIAAALLFLLGALIMEHASYGKVIRQIKANLAEAPAPQRISSPGIEKWVNSLNSALSTVDASVCRLQARSDAQFQELAGRFARADGDRTALIREMSGLNLDLTALDDPLYSAAKALRAIVNSWLRDPNRSRGRLLTNLGAHGRYCEFGFLSMNAETSAYTFKPSSLRAWLWYRLPEGTEALAIPLRIKSADTASKCYAGAEPPGEIAKILEVCRLSDPVGSGQHKILTPGTLLMNGTDDTLSAVLKEKFEMLVYELARVQKQSSEINRLRATIDEICFRGIPGTALACPYGDAAHSTSGPILNSQNEKSHRVRSLTWDGLANGWWNTPLSTAGITSDGSPENYLERTYFLAEEVQKFLENAGQTARLVQIVSEGGVLRLGDVRFDGPVPLDESDSPIERRALFQLFVIIERLDNQTASVLLPLGAC